MEKNKGWELIGQLTEEEKKMLDEVGACKKACEELIKNIVLHWEENSIRSDNFWRVLQEKYDPSGIDDENIYSVRDGNRVFKKSRKRQSLEKVIEELSARDIDRKYVKKIFGFKI